MGADEPQTAEKTLKIEFQAAGGNICRMFFMVD